RGGLTVWGRLMGGTPIGRLLIRLARLAAKADVIALAFEALVTVVSVIGRALIPLGLAPIPGDVELVQASILFAVFAFLPWCHIERGHAVVAIVTDRFPVQLGALIEFIWDVVMVLAAAFITWRFAFGLVDKFGNKESSFILRIPL